MILSCKGIKKAFGAADILKNVSFIVEEKEKCAIVGVNGAGKTTLFKVLAGELPYDEGEIAFKKDISIQYMPQSMTVESDKTIYDEMQTVFARIIKLEESIHEMEQEMSSASGGSLEVLMDKYHRAVAVFEAENGYEYKSRLKGVIHGLGFSDEEGRKIVSSLSGGEKTRVALGKILLSSPDLLLLDEPTNHLDLEAISWLESFLSSYNGGVIIISHDRYFLDKLVSRIVELENGVSSVYNGNYSDFSVKKEVNRQIQLKAYLDQQKEIKRQEEVIRVLRSYNREKSIKRAESREKLLSKIDMVQRPNELPSAMRMLLSTRRESGNDVLTVEGISKSYGERVLFRDITFQIKKGEKVALIGANGVGKTTVFRIIQGLLPADAGRVITGSNVSIGYYDQEHQNISMDKTIFDEIYDAYPRLTVTEIRNTLAAFVFTGDDVYKRISDLSGGEKGRVALVKIMLGNSNLLLMDEPTNHLDMQSREILEDAVNDYDGTVIYISHDRYFINNTADKVIELTPHGINSYAGNYDYYLEKKAELATGNGKIPPSSGYGAINAEADASKEGWIRKKEELAEIRKMKNTLSKCERDIALLEKKIQEFDARLLEEEVYTSPALAHEVFEKKSSAECQLLDLYEKWNQLDQAIGDPHRNPQ